MKTVYILRTSQLHPVNMAKSVEQFTAHTRIKPAAIVKMVKEAGGLPLDQYNPEELATAKDGCIYRYKHGELSEHEFLVQINRTLGKELSLEQLRECWNAMCLFPDEHMQLLQHLVDLQQSNHFHLHVIGVTNPMHIAFIKEQLIRMVPDLQVSFTTSFDHKTMDFAELLSHARTSDIRAAIGHGARTEVNLTEKGPTVLYDIEQEYAADPDFRVRLETTDLACARQQVQKPKIN